MDKINEAPRAHARGIFQHGLPPRSGIPHRRPFIHGLTPVVFWCVDKTLRKIPRKQRRAILATAKQIHAANLEGSNIKKLKGSKDLFRARVGNYRIILQTRPSRNPIIIDITKRDEKTYKNY